MKIIKFLFKLCLFLILIILICWAAFLGMFQTKQGQAWALKKTVHYLEQYTETQIQVDKIDVVFPLSLRLQDISIAQNNNPLLKMQQLDISFALWALLEGQVICSKLQAQGIHFIKLPVLPPPSLAVNEMGQAVMPFYAKIENLSLKEMTLSPALIHQLALPASLAERASHSVFSLKGSVINHPFKNSLSAQLLLDIADTMKQHPSIQCSLDLENRQLALSLHCSCFPYQILFQDQPFKLDANLSFFATAPLQTWLKTFHNQLESEEGVEGQFKLMLKTDNHPLSSALGNDILFKGKYAWQGQMIFRLWKMQLTGLGLDLKGEASFHPNSLFHCFFEGTTGELACLSSSLKKSIQGMIAIEGYVKGPLIEPTLVLKSISPALAFEDHLLEHVQSTLSLTFKKDHLEGLLDLTGEHQNHPCQITTVFQANKQSLNLSDLRLQALNSNLQGALTFNLHDFICEGRLRGYVNELRTLSFFLTDPLEGKAEINLKLKETAKRQALTCELVGQDLKWRQYRAQELVVHLEMEPIGNHPSSFHIASQIKGYQFQEADSSAALLSLSASYQVDVMRRTLSQLSCQLTAEDIASSQGQVQNAVTTIWLKNPAKEWEGDISFLLKNIKMASLDIDELEGETRIISSQQAWPFLINISGLWKEKWAVETKGTWHTSQGISQVHLHHLTGFFGSYPLRLLKTLLLSHQTERSELSNLHLQCGEAELIGHVTQDKQFYSLKFETNQMPTELIQSMSPLNLPVKGNIAFNGHLEGSLQKLVGKVKAFLHHIQITEDLFANQPLIEGEMDLHLEDSGIRLQSILHGIGQTPILVHGTLPFTIGVFPPKLNADTSAPFSLSLEAQGEIGPYMHLLYNDDNNVTGQTRLALNLSGQIQTPHIQGSLDFYNGTYESLSTGSIYRHIQAHLEGDGSTLKLQKFSAESNKNGSITATGTIHMDKNNGFPFECHIQPSQILIMESDYATIAASGSLRLFGTYKKAKLEGELTIDSAMIRMEEALPKQVKSVDITYIHVPEGQPLPVYPDSQNKGSPLEFDIKLRAPSKIMIEGKHLSSQWKGDLILTGSPRQPLLNGDLRVVQGEYDFNGKVFNLTQGNVHFAGSPSKKTSLYVVASKEIDRIRADIIVKGLTNKLVVSFRSNPPLSQREILSYILFNRGIADITPDQGDQLSQSFISLNNDQEQSSGNDFLSRLRKNIGIDRLDITSSDKANKDLSLQVGKHITENVFVSINKSISDIGNKVAIEANLRKNLKAQAEVELESGTQGKVSLKWKKDY